MMKNAMLYRILITISCLILISACNQSSTRWHLQLSHSANGDVLRGSHANLINSIRSGCEIRVAWGARRKADPQRTIEHIATPLWVAVRDGMQVEVQLDDFLINLPVLGEPETDHTRRAQFGGTSEVVMWRANLKTDGSFDAVWFKPHSGEFVYRAPQQHPMKWFSDCAAVDSTSTLYE